jgi:DNA-binding MarR family transcriptional regulator
MTSRHRDVARASGAQEAAEPPPGSGQALLSPELGVMPRLLLRGLRWFEEGLFALLAEEGWPGIGLTHSAIFGNLDKRGTRESELARRIGVSRQSVHETIRDLQRLELVELIPDSTNRSAKLVVLTPTGRRHVRAAVRAFATLEEELAHRIGARAARELRWALERDWGTPLGHERAVEERNRA